MNPLFLTDSYKVTHAPQYPPGTSLVESYLSSRGGEHPYTVWAGLSGMLQVYLAGVFVQQHHIHEAQKSMRDHFGGELFNLAGWTHIVRDHGGKLPIEIRAVAEGSVVPVKNALMVVRNTCPHCYWVTNWVETLLVKLWYPTTVATISRRCKELILQYLHRTGDITGVDFKLHDFGYRGVSSVESAAIGGWAHLINFKGTDTLAALEYAKMHYGEYCAGFSIPASEHSTITSWGQSREGDAYDNMLKTYPGMFACVSDSYDIANAIALWGTHAVEIMNAGRTVVVRPDSGHPPVMVLDCVEQLSQHFGWSVNKKGYKVLHDTIRVIQGDGIDIVSIDHILQNLTAHGWSADNVAFGMGGALLQRCDRDTQKFAMKCSYVEINGQGQDVFKDPVSDPTKASLRGRLALWRQGDEWKTVPFNSIPREQDELKTVFKDGVILKFPRMSDIRNRADVQAMTYSY